MFSCCGPVIQEIADADNHELEAGLGFPLFTEGEDRLGWLININTVSTYCQYLSTRGYALHRRLKDMLGTLMMWCSCRRPCRTGRLTMWSAPSTATS